MSLYRIQSWDNKLNPFGMKIARVMARAVLMLATLTVSPLDLLNNGSNNNQDIGGPFHHFVFLHL
jgi:hypothetical protein